MRVKLFIDSRDNVVAIVIIRGYTAGKGKKLFFPKLADPTWVTQNLTFHGYRSSVWAYRECRMKFIFFLQ